MPDRPAVLVTLCSWRDAPHEMTPEGSPFCRRCSHDAEQARAFCSCAACLGHLPNVLTQAAIDALAAELAGRLRSTE